MGKKYILSDGKHWTAQELADYTGYPIEFIYKRLARTRDYEKIIQSKFAGRSTAKNTLKIIESRPFYCDMFKLAMKKI